MVILLIHLLLLLPSFLYSGEFTACVREREVTINEGVNLELTLKDAIPKSAPSLDSLNPAFHIHSQGQSSSTSIINGKANSSTTWTLILIPNKLGQIEIPPIGIETSVGRLFTNLISINVVNEKKDQQVKKDAKIRLETDVSNYNPYKNEPFFLIVRLISKQQLTNIRVDKFNIEEAILESVGAPIIEEKMEDGINFGVVEFKYMITPLKSGLMKISPIKVFGDIPSQKNTSSIFDDMFGSFTMMQGLVSLQPFSLVTKEIEIDVHKAVAGQIPWLPAYSLEIQESLDSSQIFREGEVFNRCFTITAEGIHSSQLPNLEEKLMASNQFKVYADKPQFKDEIVNGKLISSRIEQYTLIPEKSGELLLPEITVNWWNLNLEKRSETHVKERKLQVLPALSLRNEEIALNEISKQIKEKEESTLLTSQTNHLYVVLGGLVLLILILIVIIFVFQRKLSRIVKSQNKKEPHVLSEKKQKIIPAILVNQSDSRIKTEKLKDLNPT